jgi:hypothetical protein
MPRIRILQAIAGLDFSWVAGQEVDVDTDTAKAWLTGGERAELVRGETLDTPERAASTEKTTKARSRSTKPADG